MFQLHDRYSPHDMDVEQYKSIAEILRESMMNSTYFYLEKIFYIDITKREKKTWFVQKKRIYTLEWRDGRETKKNEIKDNVN